MKALWKNPLPLAAIACLLALPQARAQQQNHDLLAKQIRSLTGKIQPSLCFIKYTRVSEDARQEREAPGIIVTEDGLVATLSQAFPPSIPVSEFQDIKILLPGEPEVELKAEYYGRNDEAMLAFVKATEGRKFQPLSFANSPDPQFAQQVVAIGRLGKQAGRRVHFGIGRITGHIASPKIYLINPPTRVMQGAVVVAMDGTPLGITIDREGGMLLPASEFRFAIENPPSAEKPAPRPWMAVSIEGVSKKLAKLIGIDPEMPAVQVTDVPRGKAADKAGLKTGDIIIAVNGKPLAKGDTEQQTAAMLIRYIRRHFKPDQAIMLTVLRGKVDAQGRAVLKPDGTREMEKMELKVTLMAEPKRPSEARRYYVRELGMTVRELVWNDTYRRKLPEDEKGVLVVFMPQGSRAGQAGLRLDDIIKKVNEKPVESLEQFKRLMKEIIAKRPKEVVLLVHRGFAETAVIRIELPQQ